MTGMMAKIGAAVREELFAPTEKVDAMTDETASREDEEFIELARSIHKRLREENAKLQALVESLTVERDHYKGQCDVTLDRLNTMTAERDAYQRGHASFESDFEQIAGLMVNAKKRAAGRVFGERQRPTLRGVPLQPIEGETPAVPRFLMRGRGAEATSVNLERLASAIEDPASPDDVIDNLNESSEKP